MDLEKFSRNILLNEIDVSGQQSICNTSVLCIGCGGLASFVLPLLVASGIKKLSILDFDTIEKSNLPRQIMFTDDDISKPKVDVAKYFLRGRRKECIINAIQKKHDFADNLIQDCDIIVDLTDSKSSRLFCNNLSLKYKKPFFTGSAQGFVGHVYSFANHLSNFPCYECLFGAEEANSEINCNNAGVFSPVVEIIGGLISSNILKFVAGIPLNFYEFLLVDIKDHNFKKIKLSKDPSCSCSIK